MSPLRSHAGCSWAGVWVAVALLTTATQIILVAIPDESLYWFAYHTSTDILELAMAMALFSAVPYTRVALKVTAAGISIWQLYCMASQLISDYFLVGLGSNSSTISAFTTAALAIAWLTRFSIRWRPSQSQDLYGKFYEVIGRPSNISQLFAAMYTGVGGSFAITDGASLWCYSRSEGCMVQKKLNPGYLTGKMIVEICNTEGAKYDELTSMVGRPFSPLHNCLELQSLAGRWR